MSILDSILKSQGGALVKQMAGSLGVSEGQAGAAVTQLLPALTQGMKRNVEKPQGLEALMGALQRGGHQQYVDNPAKLADLSTIADGNAILGHLLGSKDASRQVAAQAAQKTGLDTGILKKMLPMVAAAAMGSLGKESQGGGALSSLMSGLAGGGGSSAGAGLLGAFLDKGNDGVDVGDMLNFAKKLF
ncbi:MAG: DUF937 domain-containing protein [Pseudomonadota bacterium]